MAVSHPTDRTGAPPRQFESELLRLCHLAGDLDALMKDLTGYFARVTGCEAVGIRLGSEGDFPYYTTRGFSDDFVRAERSLCTRTAAGDVERDAAGHPELACMCGNVICGRVDPSKPFFTAAGSFWTNSTSELLATTTEADRVRTRNRCGGEGYQSAALIPLRSGTRTFGLVQCNDHQAGRFDASAIAELEHLADYVAIALARFDVEDSLRHAKEMYRVVADQTYDWELWVEPGDRVIYTSPSCERITGHPVEAFLRDPGLRRRLIAPEDVDAWDRHRVECHLAGVGGTATFRLVRPDGESRWVDHVCRPVFDAAGHLSGIRGSNRDVTDRHRAEEARDMALAAQEHLVRELKEALARVKTLRGFIPICAACKKIRDDAGYWQAVEVYVHDHTEAEFSHGLCPACAERLYPGITDETER